MNMDIKSQNNDVVTDFGQEWSQFTNERDTAALSNAYNKYFKIFPNKVLNKDSIDMLLMTSC